MITKMYQYRGLLILLFFISIAAITWFLYAQNNALTINELTIKDEVIPEAFEGYRIVQLSDLHNKRFGHDQHKLIEKVEELAPDLIVITGDLIDSRRYDASPVIELVQQLTDQFPVYYVTGNHEWNSGQYDTLLQQLKEVDAKELSNTMVKLERDGSTIELLGIEDPTFYETMSNSEAITQSIETALANSSDQDNYRVLLSHRPEQFLRYQAQPIDLVLTGHAHGGQIRIPFLGGLVAPDQGFFPTYTAGVFEENGTTMIVNRGLGNSVIPFRLFNRPEIIVVTLEK